MCKGLEVGGENLRKLVVSNLVTHFQLRTAARWGYMPATAGDVPESRSDCGALEKNSLNTLNRTL